MSPRLYKILLRPLLFRLDPEQAHHFALFCLQQIPRSPHLLRALTPTPDPKLARTIFGLTFPNPIGLAAGFDKNALALLAWPALGFGFVEAGTVTAQPQPGNPKPRIFRLPEQQALINRLGFNNDGADAVAARLQSLRASGRWPANPIGINIGKSKVTPIEDATADYVYSFEKLFPHADYVVLNVSSPNTPGLRQLQDRAALDELLCAVQDSNRALCHPERSEGPLGNPQRAQRPGADEPEVIKPILVKIAPDLTFEQIAEIIELAETHKLAGIVATNTTIDHSGVPESRRQQGGLSGTPLRDRATAIVRFISSKTSLPIIAVGGIDSARAAQEKFDAGASLIQLYTGFVYQGPRLIREICEALTERSAPPKRA